ncbi:MAG TPA: hypothetical protein VFR23_19420 [Jiangellaceae bacterium]|nr:hypothetical protein [Jiangellaceae bacterium]
MARLWLDRHAVPAVHHDPGRQTVSLTIHGITVTMPADEARRFGDEWAAALAGLAVKGAALAEVDRG